MPFGRNRLRICIWKIYKETKDGREGYWNSSGLDGSHVGLGLGMGIRQPHHDQTLNQGLRSVHHSDGDGDRVDLLGWSLLDSGPFGGVMGVDSLGLAGRSSHPYFSTTPPDSENREEKALKNEQEQKERPETTTSKDQVGRWDFDPTDHILQTTGDHDMDQHVQQQSPDQYDQRNMDENEREKFSARDQTAEGHSVDGGWNASGKKIARRSGRRACAEYELHRCNFIGVSLFRGNCGAFKGGSCRSADVREGQNGCQMLALRRTL